MDIVTHLLHYLSAYLVIIVVIGIVIGIYSDRFTPATSFLAGTLFLVVFGSIEVESFLISFSNKQIITIFLLIFITVAIRQNTQIEKLFARFFKVTDSSRYFMLKLTVMVAFFSSFLNNTPIVSMLMGSVQNWARRKKLSPSKFMIPLSYAAMLGGMITVIGTSTNLVLQGLLSSSELPLLGLLDYLVVGSIVCAAGLVFLILFGTQLLPDRKMAMRSFSDNIGEYIHEVELAVQNDLVGKTVVEAGMKNLQGIYLIEISRNGEMITPVSPDVIIEQHDHFYFAGDTERVVEFVEGQKGLTLPSEEKLEKVGEGNIVEVVIAANSKLNGMKVKDSSFRQHYNASIMGIHRDGAKISGKIGFERLRSGDLLLLLTGSDFANRIGQDRDLYLVSEIRKVRMAEESRRSWPHILLQLFNLCMVLTGNFTFFVGLLIALFLLTTFNYLKVSTLKKNFDLDLLIVLGCAITIGREFIDSGAADMISSGFLMVMEGVGPRVILFMLFVFTAVLTSFITNVAAVSIAFPVAYALATQMQMDGAPFFLTIAFAASAAFVTPIGYQTNMMVYGPGGYKSIDFLKIGLPLLVLYTAVSLFTIYWWFDLG